MTAREQRRKYVLNVLDEFPTQVAAAEELGIDTRVLNRWVTGESFPSPTIVRLVQLWSAMNSIKASIPAPLDFV